MPDHLFVDDGGLSSTIQDFGRFGYQRFGISPSGPMDRDAMVLANALVGNAAGEAVVETTLAGPTVLVEAGHCRLAYAGAEASILLNGAPVPTWTAFDVRRGDRLAIGACKQGMRGYLAVAGGIATPAILGSRSTHARNGLGGIEGRPLRHGDRIAISAGAFAGPCLTLPASARPPRGDTVRVLLGPQDDAFEAEGIAAFLESAYRLTAKSDRMGTQLEGEPIRHGPAGFNIVSDGIMNGSVQVPGSGQPIVLLADRQTTGGYPKIATVITPDLAIVGQRRPGETIRFRAVSAAEAERAVRVAAACLEASRAALRPVRVGRSFSSRELLAVNLTSGLHRDV